MAHLFIVVVYDSFNRNNVKISKTYNFPDFSFFMSQDDAHYHNHQNAPHPHGWDVDLCVKSPHEVTARAVVTVCYEQGSVGEIERG